jgi:hypothetical protein
MHTALNGRDGPVAAVLTPGAFERARSGFDARVVEVAERCRTDVPKDVQDHLFFHTYVANWILAPGNFKLPLLSARRPLMARSVVDQVQRLSPRLRVDKMAYVALLEARFPAIMVDKPTAVPDGVPWAELCRVDGPVRDELRRLLIDELDDHPLRRQLDADGVVSLLQQATPGQEGPAASAFRSRVNRRVYDMRRVLSRSERLGRVAAAAQPIALRVLGARRRGKLSQSHPVLLRLALLSLLNQRLRQVRAPS